MVELVFTGKEVSGGSRFRIPFPFDGSKCIDVHLIVVNHFGGDVGFATKAEGSRELGHLVGRSGRKLRRGATRIDPLNECLRYRVRIVAYVIFETFAIVPHMVGPNRATILETDDVCPRSGQGGEESRR
jgi:hypothetical protein